MRTLLLGFGPFLEIRDNHSAHVVTALAKEAGDSVRAVVLPVVFEACTERIPAIIDEFQPDNILLCGVARRASQLALECVAINALHADAPDASGAYSFDSHVVPGAPPAYRAAFDLRAWLEALRADGIAAGLSFHAGTYVCNQAYFLAAHTMHERTGRVPVVLVHIPPIAGQVPPEQSAIVMPFDRILTGVRRCLTLLRNGTR